MRVRKGKGGKGEGIPGNTKEDKQQKIFWYLKGCLLCGEITTEEFNV